MTFLEKWNRLPVDARMKVLKELHEMLLYRGKDRSGSRIGPPCCLEGIERIAAIFASNGFEMEEYT